MENVKDLIPDEQLSTAWGNANFGNMSKRDVVSNTLLKCASGYCTGHTAKSIVIDLGLVNRDKWKLTKKGKEYLFAAFSGGKSL